ncbi:MAG: diguanylate cyclase [Coleofasciculaceae cyanobacterium SM2_1_6]|nr:diguanylate cyclase [Coleofasciculaceae cyanobacterium SM2_1_6]
MRVSEGDRSIAASQDQENLDYALLYRLHQAQVAWNHLNKKLTRRLQQSLSLPEILQTTAEEVNSLLGCDRLLFYRFDSDWSGQIIVESVSAPPWSLLNQTVQDSCLRTHWLNPCPEEEFRAIEDVLNASLIPCYGEFLARFQVRAYLVMPIFRESHLWGLLIAHSCTAPRQWQVPEIAGLQQTAINIGLALQQSSLVEQLQTTTADLNLQVAFRTEKLERTNQALAKESQKHYQATIELAQREEFLRQVLDSLLTFVGVLTPDGILVEINQYPLNVAGLRREDVLNQPLAATYWWVYSPTAQAQIRGAIYQANQGIFVKFDIPIQIQGGDQVLLEFSLNPLKNAPGQITHLIFSGIDITDRKQTELALQQSEAKNQALIQAIPDFLIQMRRDGLQLQVINEGLIHYLRPKNDRPQYHITEALPPEIAQERIHLAQIAIATGQTQYHEYKFVDQGSTYYEEARIAPLWNEEVLVVVRDITSRKQNELKLQQANQELETSIANLQQRNQEMLRLNEMSEFLQSCLTEAEACQAIANLVKPLFPHCAGRLFIIDGSQNLVKNVGSWGDYLCSVPEFFPQDCWALRRGRIHLVELLNLGLYCHHVPQDAGIATTLCIPMITQGETMGLFYLSTKITAALPAAKQQLGRTVAEQLALAIANLRLRETLQNRSIRDSLTGLFNRRYLEEILIQELARAQRKHHSLSLIMLDIDHFKLFNDTYGHEVGDYVLQSVGQLLRESIRDSDTACRYGGEEIVLVLPEISLDQAQIKAEGIRRAIAQLPLSHNGQSLFPLTISLGVAAFPQHGTTGAAVIQAADAALYRAKAAGRNQVIVAL